MPTPKPNAAPPHEIRFFFCVILIGGVCGASTLHAADPQPPAKEEKATDNDLRIRGVFDAPLPGTERKSSLRFILHPHLGDVTKRDHLRTAVGLRYGLTKRWEVSGEADSYFTHGLKKGSFFENKGFSTVHLGTKLALGDPFRLKWDTSVGVEWQHPVGRPPLDVNDGLQHWRPFISFSHELASHPGWRVFWGGGWDDVTKTSIKGQLDKNQLGQDTTNLTGGLLYQRGPFTYTLEGTWETTRLLSADKEDILSLRPGIVWVLPSKYTFGSKSGRWLVGAALRISHGPDGYDLGLGAKLRVNLDFKRLIGRKK